MGLFTRIKKNVPHLICVQSKNNLPSLSTAHWARLVKESVSKERESKYYRGPNKKKRGKGQEKREGLRWKMEHKWEGRDRVRAKKEKKEECWERCGTGIFESENEFMKL